MCLGTFYVRISPVCFFIWRSGYQEGGDWNPEILGFNSATYDFNFNYYIDKISLDGFIDKNIEIWY
jgi:hypothetical protein